MAMDWTRGSERVFWLSRLEGRVFAREEDEGAAGVGDGRCGVGEVGGDDFFGVAEVGGEKEVGGVAVEYLGGEGRRGGVAGDELDAGGVLEGVSEGGQTDCRSAAARTRISRGAFDCAVPCDGRARAVRQIRMAQICSRCGV
jgi:hypothetical protein